MLTNVRYILLTALRDWFFAALLIGIIVCGLIAHMLGSTAIIETQEMTLSFTAASSRTIIMTGLMVFICFHVRNAFDTREIDVFLSRPITRFSLVLSYWLGFAIVAFLLVIPTVGLVAMGGLLSHPGFIFWALSLLIECWLVVTVALLSAFTLKSVVSSILASMGFYVLARMMGFFIVITQTTLPVQQKGMHVLPGYVLKAISFLVPRLDFFARSEWLVYGLKNPADLKRTVAQAFLFILVLIFCTIIGFNRKQF